jgi:hypothetical protein
LDKSVVRFTQIWEELLGAKNAGLSVILALLASTDKKEPLNNLVTVTNLMLGFWLES